MPKTVEAMVPHMAPVSNTPKLADADAGLLHIFVRDLVLSCSIGVHRHERDAPQRVRLNLDLAVSENDRPSSDLIDETVSYETIVGKARVVVAARHFNLVETLAEELAKICLEDARVQMARIRVEKLDVFPDASAVGVEIDRRQKKI